MSEKLTARLLHRVFFYGTLKRGEPNHGLLSSGGQCTFLGVGRTANKYPLVIATKYNIPFLLKKTGIGENVIGELYDVDSEMLSRLDDLEEHPTFYERFEDEVLMVPQPKLKSDLNFEEDGCLTNAWIYFIPKFNPSLLTKPMYKSYTNEGSHGLKYCKREIRDTSYEHKKEVLDASCEDR